MFNSRVRASIKSRDFSNLAPSETKDYPSSSKPRNTEEEFSKQMKVMVEEVRQKVRQEANEACIRSFRDKFFPTPTSGASDLTQNQLPLTSKVI